MSAIELWSSTNHTMFSDVFSVAPGKVCVLFATGFEYDRVRVDNSEFAAKQSVCVRRIKHSHGLVWQRNAVCDWIATPTTAVEVGDELVQVNGCGWTLDKCNNLRIIGVPGTYRLELNDATAIGVLQVYAEQFDAVAFSPSVGHLFF